MRRKRTGKRALTLALALSLAAGAIPAAGDDKHASAAVIAGTVFRENGLSLRGAQIVITGQEKGKKKEWKAVSDPRGEFLSRVPAGPADYTVSVKASGHRSYQKKITLAADERIDLSIILESESGTR